MATHSSILAWRLPMNKRSLAGYSPWGRKQLDTNEVTWHAGTRIKHWRSLCASVGLIHKNIKVRTFLDLKFFDSLCSLTKDGGGEWDKNITEIREFSQRQNKMRVNKDLGKEKGVCESVCVFFFFLWVLMRQKFPPLFFCSESLWGWSEHFTSFLYVIKEQI